MIKKFSYKFNQQAKKALGHLLGKYQFENFLFLKLYFILKEMFKTWKSNNKHMNEIDIISEFQIKDESNFVERFIFQIY